MARRIAHPSCVASQPEDPPRLIANPDGRASICPHCFARGKAYQTQETAGSRMVSYHCPACDCLWEHTTMLTSDTRRHD